MKIDKFIILCFLFLIFIFSPIKIYALDFYIGFGIIGSTSYSLSIYNNNYESIMKIYDGETIFLGLTFPFINNYLFNIQLGYISKGLYALGDYYFFFYEAIARSFFTKTIVDNKFLNLGFNYGLWISYLFYSVYKSRNFASIIDKIDNSNFSSFNFGIYFGYQLKFKNIALEISTNLGFIDENNMDSEYFLSAWFEMCFIYKI